MCLCRPSALWAGGVIFVLVFLAAEELADATSVAMTPAEPIAQQYIEDDDSSWEQSANDAEERAADLQVSEPAGAAALAAAPAPVGSVGEPDARPSLYVGHGGPTPARAAAPETVPVDKRNSRTVQRVCRVTAYCDRGLTAAGVRSGVGQCAAPVDIPLGSTVYIPALHRKFVVTDRTHRRFRHNTVDLFIPSEMQCHKFGRRYLDCEFTLVEEPVRYGELRLAQGH